MDLVADGNINLNTVDPFEIFRDKRLTMYFDGTVRGDEIRSILIRGKNHITGEAVKRKKIESENEYKELKGHDILMVVTVEGQKQKLTAMKCLLYEKITSQLQFCVWSKFKFGFQGIVFPMTQANLRTRDGYDKECFSDQTPSQTSCGSGGSSSFQSEFQRLVKLRDGEECCVHGSSCTFAKCCCHIIGVNDYPQPKAWEECRRFCMYLPANGLVLCVKLEEEYTAGSCCIDKIVGNMVFEEDFDFIKCELDPSIKVFAFTRQVFRLT